MGILDFLFGDQEDKYKELWNRLSEMPPEQLTDIIQARPNTLHGVLACVALYRISVGSLSMILDEDRAGSGGFLVQKISSLRKNDLILMGKGQVFADIRQTLKSMTPLLEQYGA